MVMELDLYKAFFQAWKDLHALGAKKKPGRPSLEHQAAAELLVQRAKAIEAYTPNLTAQPAAVAVSGAVQDYRMLQREVAAIPPKVGPKPAETVVVVRQEPRSNG